VELVEAGVPYSKHVHATLGGIPLDPVYEAKCAGMLQAGDLFWLVGHRDAAPAGARERPLWVQGDALKVLPSAPPADFLFTCPPYGDLERYSDEPEDLSTLEFDAFVPAYRAIIQAAAQRLRPDRFAALVVGNYRDKRGGYYRDFVGETVRAFQAAGLVYYNEAVLVTPRGSLPVRITKQFIAGRKMGKSHQNLLVFLKGDSSRAAAACRKEGEEQWAGVIL